MNWDQKLVQLDSNECDCIWSGMTILDSMKDTGYVISKPYYDNTQVIMVKEGSDIKSSADLAGKSVAVQLGTSGESLLSEGGDLESLAKTFGSLMTCDSFLKCFTELGGGAVDAVIVDKPVATSYVQQNAGFSPSSMRSSAPSSTASPSAPAIRSCATPSRPPCRSLLTTAPMPRSPRSIPTSSTTCCF
ncbi:MAG: transporter substrate-binding domain-containing protein [Oscillospiraceae bacterium]